MELVSDLNNISWPKISIVTPSYNQGKYLEETIISVLNQNYPNLEYIIIDGGSSDESIDIIKRYEDKITYWVSEKDNGQSNAINKGFKICTGEIITWLNSDDLLVKDSLFIIAKQFQYSPSQILVGGSSHWDPINNILIEHTSKPKFFKDLLKYYKGFYLAQPSVFYKKDLLVESGYLNENLHYTMDLDLWLRFGLIEGINKKITYISDTMSLMRLHSEQKTSKHNFKAMKEAAIVVLKYSKRYGLRLGNRILLAFKNREFRYHMSLHSVNRFRFLDMIIYSAIRKIG